MALLLPVLAEAKGAGHGELNDLLISAAFHGRQNEVEDLLRRGADVNTRDPEDGSTPLIVATQRDRTRVVSVLLQRGADVRAKDDTGFVSLVYATKPEIAKLLIEKGADVNARGMDKMTPLIRSASDGLMDMVKLLVDKGADVKAQDGRGRTALIASIENGFPEMAKLLVHRGSDIHAVDERGWTPLMHAVAGGNLDLVASLLQKGADPNGKNKSGNPVFMYSLNRISVAEKLLDAGARVNAGNDEDGMTLLMKSAAQGDYRFTEFLLERRADVNLKTKNGETALFWAVKFGHRKTADLLKQHGAVE